MIIFQLWEKDFLKEPSSVYTVLQNSELNKIRLSTLIPYLNLKTVALPSPPLSTDDEKFINNVVVTLDNILKVSFFDCLGYPYFKDCQNLLALFYDDYLESIQYLFPFLAKNWLAPTGMNSVAYV